MDTHKIDQASTYNEESSRGVGKCGGFREDGRGIRLESLEYLDMVLKEAMRLHPVAPLLLPHESLEDCTINSYHIPRKSRLMINVWAIGRDPSVWTKLEKFNPERFVGSNIDLRGHDFELILFG